MQPVPLDRSYLLLLYLGKVCTHIWFEVDPHFVVLILLVSSFINRFISKIVLSDWEVVCLGKWYIAISARTKSYHTTRTASFVAQNSDRTVLQYVQNKTTFDAFGTNRQIVLESSAQLCFFSITNSHVLPSNEPRVVPTSHHHTLTACKIRNIPSGQVLYVFARNLQMNGSTRRAQESHTLRTFRKHFTGCRCKQSKLFLKKNASDRYTFISSLFWPSSKHFDCILQSFPKKNWKCRTTPQSRTTTNRFWRNTGDTNFFTPKNILHIVQNISETVPDFYYCWTVIQVAKSKQSTVSNLSMASQVRFTRFHTMQKWKTETVNGQDWKEAVLQNYRARRNRAGCTDCLSF